MKRNQPNLNSARQLPKPFLKWAGGKSQLLPEIRKYYPFGKNIRRYVEPFVGGGAVLFDILSSYQLDEVFICDNNPALINTYQVVRDSVDELIERLAGLEDIFLQKDTEKRKEYFYSMRERYNHLIKEGLDLGNVEWATLTIFLNRTCFNGLYRVNKKGEFNVPVGRYKNPKICDRENLEAVSQVLQNVDMRCGDYTTLLSVIDAHTFVYIDPPYRPITRTSSFTSYTQDSFTDDDQIRLATFTEEIDRIGARFLLSNSDPKNHDPDDNFFDSMYATRDIKRVQAKRMINRNASQRGQIYELLVSNGGGYDG